jgi:hypothetical protein
LWFYLLAEAERLAGGQHLGPVGGRLVAEVLLGLLENDKTSWINVDPNWSTAIPTSGPRPSLADVITYTTA